VTTSPDHTPTTPLGYSDAVAAFDVVRRGYDRDQVDARLNELAAQLATATKARQETEERLRTTDQQLRALRAREADSPMSQDSFGFRAEKILRMAEHEAADVRSRAAKEATSIIEQARSQADKHRQEIEQKLATRTAELDQEVAHHHLAIQEREQQAQAMLDDARQEAARVSDEAQRNAEKLLTDAQTRVDQLHERSEKDRRRRREAAEQELRRLSSLHDDVRGEIGRLHALLGTEINNHDGIAAVLEPRRKTASPIGSRA